MLVRRVRSGAISFPSNCVAAIVTACVVSEKAERAVVSERSPSFSKRKVYAYIDSVSWSLSLREMFAFRSSFASSSASDAKDEKEEAV